MLTLEITLYWHWQSFLFCPFTLLSKVRATFVLVDQERVLDCGGDDDGDDDFGRTRTMMRMEITMTELQFFTQIIFVQLNLPQRKSFCHLKY